MCRRLEKWVFRGDNWAKWCKNGKGEGSKSGKLDSAKECKRYTKVFRVGKLLQIVCQRFCKNSKAVKLGREAAESFCRVEEGVYDRTSLDNTRLG